MPQRQTNKRKPKPEIDPHERQRLEKLNVFERAARQNGYKAIAGVDEAGRGPLAGPVVAAACILPEDFFLPGVDDSKKLTPEVRHRLFEQITGDDRICFGVGIVPSEVIDKLNILQATILAMLEAVSKLVQQPDVLLVDGLMLRHQAIPCEKIIGGDAKSQSIAAASIVAKETRDRLMCEYHARWPVYGFDKHKGYGTKVHLEAIARHGICEIHRKSFDPIKSQLNPNPELQFLSSSWP